MPLAYAKKITRPKTPYLVDERDYGAEFRQSRDALYSRFDTRTSEVFEGRNRRVYVLKNYVVKIPMNDDGIADNSWEGSVSNGARPLREYDVVYARTRLATFFDLPVLLMERVNPVSPYKIREMFGKVPKWVDRVDCGQVGFTKDGRLVAYDYGIR